MLLTTVTTNCDDLWPQNSTVILRTWLQSMWKLPHEYQIPPVEDEEIHNAVIDKQLRSILLVEISLIILWIYKVLWVTQAVVYIFMYWQLYRHFQTLCKKSLAKLWTNFNTVSMYGLQLLLFWFYPWYTTLEMTICDI